jgi:hypothetical protein
MTLEEHISRMKQLANELLVADTPVRLASYSALDEFSKRVFERGESATGGKFVYEGTKPLYLNPDTAIGSFTVGGKPKKEGGRRSKTKTVTQKFGAFEQNSLANIGKKTKIERKTRWFKSYLDYRKEIGREYNFVNWRLGGDLKSDIENNGTMTTRKVGDADYVIESTNKENDDKLRGFATKYPNVFKLSESEKKTYYKAFEFEFLKLIRERLR